MWGQIILKLQKAYVPACSTSWSRAQNCYDSWQQSYFEQSKAFLMPALAMFSTIDGFDRTFLPQLPYSWWLWALDSNEGSLQAASLCSSLVLRTYRGLIIIPSPWSWSSKTGRYAWYDNGTLSSSSSLSLIRSNSDKVFTSISSTFT